MKRLMTSIVVIILLGLWIIQEVTAIELTQTEHERLAKGEVIVHLKAVRGPIKEGTAIGVIDVPPEKVFRVVTDNEDFEEFMPYVKQSDVERIKERSIMNYQYLDFPFPIGDRYYKLHILHISKTQIMERFLSRLGPMSKDQEISKTLMVRGFWKNMVKERHWPSM